jgi:hypothetical protein
MPFGSMLFFGGVQVPWDPTHNDGWDHEPGACP